MKHLILIFNERNEFNRAKQWFSTESAFYYDHSNEGGMALYFPEEDLDALELAINEELAEEEFAGYHFESEY